MRTSSSFELKYDSSFKEQLLFWAQQFREVVFLDSNNYNQKYSNYDFILAVDAFTSIQTDSINAFEDVKQYQQTTADWIFGYLSYDLKNDIEDLNSNNFDGLAFPDVFFFQPKKLFLIKGNVLEMKYLAMCDDEIQEDIDAILKVEVQQKEQNFALEIQARISKATYLEKLDLILKHIQNGDVYEVNFCQEFFSENTSIDPYIVYRNLNNISNPPFAFYLKNNNFFALSASPERYLCKKGNKIISQPIKGTSKRFLEEVTDLQAKTDLESNPKERSENIMIVDLVRNDLSKTAEKGSVQVEELCKVYTFKQVHQMISTIVSEVSPNVSPLEIIKSTFPMGSMTGAPKIAAMQIIEKQEATKRGLYSGAVGYFTPDNDFDFNVVIRSILYNQQNKYLSFSVGSAITALSEPEQEYQECWVKAQAMHQVLTS